MNAGDESQKEIEEEKERKRSQINKYKYNTQLLFLLSR